MSNEITEPKARQDRPRTSARSSRCTPIRLAPPKLVPISDSDWEDAISALAEMLVPILDRRDERARAA